jgi:hypothetical protein
MAFDVFWVSAIARSKFPARETSHATVITAKVVNAAPPNPVPQEKQRNHKKKKALATEMPDIPVLCYLASISANENCFGNDSRKKDNAFVETKVEMLKNAVEE